MQHPQPSHAVLRQWYAALAAQHAEGFVASGFRQREVLCSGQHGAQQACPSQRIGGMVAHHQGAGDGGFIAAVGGRQVLGRDADKAFDGIVLFEDQGR